MRGYDGREGYKKLIAWQELSNLRHEIFEVTKHFPASQVRRVSQMNDAARSAKQNLQEGYMGGSLAVYIRSVNICRGSLAELLGDLEDCLEDHLISNEEFNRLEDRLRRADYLIMRLIKGLRAKQKA